MRGRQAILSLTAVLAALAVLALITAITLLSPSTAQAKPIPHGPNSVTVPSPEAGPPLVTPTPGPNSRAHTQGVIQHGG